MKREKEKAKDLWDTATTVEDMDTQPGIALREKAKEGKDSTREKAREKEERMELRAKEKEKDFKGTATTVADSGIRQRIVGRGKEKGAKE